MSFFRLATLATLALWGTLLPVAEASDPDVQELRYSLSIDGREVGTRTVSIRHFPPAEGSTLESRVIESWTELDATLAGMPVQVRSRESARILGGRSSFTAAVIENGKARDVQGRRMSNGGWRVSVVADGQRTSTRLKRSEVTLTSMDLLDPERHGLLAAAPSAHVLVASSGEVYVGTVEDLGESMARVGQVPVPVQSYSWSPGQGAVQMSWSLDGTLVSYDMGFMGYTLHAQLDAMPAARVFGQIDLTGVSTGDVTEEDL
jgi:hypothetical protein